MIRGSDRAWRCSAAAGIVLWVAAGCAWLPEEELDAVPTLIAPPESRIVTYAAERRFLAEEIGGLARIAPTREQTLYFTRDGRIRHFEVSTGDAVEQGQVLAQIDVESLERDLELLKYDVQISTMRLERAQADPARLPFEVRIQELEHAKLEQRMDYLVRTIERATIRAPFDGVVTAIYTGVGQEVRAYANVVTVADPSELEIQLQLSSEDDFNRLARGQQARVEVARNRWVEAEVRQVPTVAQRFADGPERDRRVRLALTEDPGAELGMGSLVDVVITVRENDDALIVPLSAIRQFMGRTYVRVLEGEARREVDVQLGLRGATHVEVVAGLEEGDVVIGQ